MQEGWLYLLPSFKISSDPFVEGQLNIRAVGKTVNDLLIHPVFEVVAICPLEDFDLLNIFQSPDLALKRRDALLQFFHCHCGASFGHTNPRIVETPPLYSTTGRERKKVGMPRRYLVVTLLRVVKPATTACWMLFAQTTVDCPGNHFTENSAKSPKQVLRYRPSGTTPCSKKARWCPGHT
jgi:hypothetical protein